MALPVPGDIWAHSELYLLLVWLLHGSVLPTVQCSASSVVPAPQHSGTGQCPYKMCYHLYLDAEI